MNTVDIEKTMAKGWIVYREKGVWMWFDLFIDWSLTVFHGIMSIAILEMWRQGGLLDLFAALVMTPMFAFFFSGFYGGLFGRKMIRLKGNYDVEKHKEIILDFFKKHYPRNNFYTGKNFLTSYKKRRWLLGSRNRIIVCLRENEVLVNIVNFNSRDMIIPYTVWYHHLMIFRLRAALLSDRFLRQ